jgi:chromosome segregation ATPase
MHKNIEDDLDIDLVVHRDPMDRAVNTIYKLEDKLFEMEREISTLRVENEELLALTRDMSSNLYQVRYKLENLTSTIKWNMAAIAFGLAIAFVKFS